MSDSGDPQAALKLGLFLPQGPKFDLRSGILDSARAAEQIGYDSVWVFERVLYARDQSGVHRLGEYGDGTWPDFYRSVPEPLVALSMAAAVTERVRLGTAALVAGLHMPLRLAKTLATLDAASGGRVVAGLGSGWSLDEFTAIAPRPLEERGAALEEFLDIADAAWGPDPVTFQNERYRIFPAEIGPKPAGKIPVLLGGNGTKALDRVARRASGWLPSMTAPDQVKATLRTLRERAEGYGRNPAQLSCTTVVALFDLTEVPERDRQPYAGSIDQVLEDLAALKDAGVSEVVLTLPFLADSTSELVDLAATLHGKVRAAGVL
jgi:probable F420-dependent oxidoreductase